MSNYSPAGDFPNPGMDPGSPALQGDSLPSEPLRNLHLDPDKFAILRHCCVLCLSCSVMPNSCNPMECSPPGSSVHEDSSGKNTGVGLPCPPPGHLPNPGTKPRSSALQEASLPAEPPGKPLVCHILGLPVF